MFCTSTISRRLAIQCAPYTTHCVYWFCIYLTFHLYASVFPCWIYIYIYMFMVWCDLHWLDFVRHALENAGLSDCTSYGDSANSTQTNVRVQSRQFPSGKGAKSRGNKWTSLRKRVNEEKQTDKNYWAHLTGYDKRRILYDERL